MTPGLYDGFEGYRNPRTSDVEAAVQQSLVVLDTNVLLGLYNFQGSTLEDFVRVFEALGARLLVPHQVMDEFWRNRRTVLKQNQGRHREREDIEDSFATINKTLHAWYRRVVDRTSAPPKPVLNALTAARDEIFRLMDAKTTEAAATATDTPTYEDRVLAKLAPILEGRVGDAPDIAHREDLRRTGLKRLENRVPPGYMDAGKSPDRAVGDYMVWAQTMEASKERQLGVLLVTNDQKEDWWAEGGAARLPRPELVAELLDFAGQPLMMVRSHELLAMGSLLGVEVQEAAVSEAEQNVEDESGPRRTTSALAEAYKEFWERFAQAAYARKWTTGRAPSANWWLMSAGGGGNQYGVSYSKFGCRSELYLGNSDPHTNLHRFRILESRADAIQKAFGSSEVIHFEELPNAKACRLDIRLEDGRSIADRELWDNTLDWFISTQERLREAVDLTGGVPSSTPYD